MSLDSHLALEQVALRAATERSFRAPAWGFFRVHSGVGYLLQHGQAQALNPNDIVVCGGGEAVFRASQIGDLHLHYFNLAPDLLCGLLTMPESESLRAATRAIPPPLRWLPATHPAAEPFRQLSESFQTAVEHGDFAARCRMLQVMAAALAREMHELLPEVPGAQAAAVRFRELMQKMTEAELVSHPPQELAHLCGCSERHLNRLFQKFFGQSLRDRQIELRLQRARLLLRESHSKVIHVALESGFRHLSLFNSMFKRRFGVTPTQWRQRAQKPRRRRGMLPAFLMMVATGAALIGIHTAKGASETAQAMAKVAPTDAPKTAATTNAAAPTFVVKGYEIRGNTVLPADLIGKIFEDHTGPAITFDTIRGALSELQLAYRGRGFFTTAVSLPPQKLTNGFVQVQVTEGKLAEVQVLGNKWFTAENVLRALPYVKTNVILNSLVFQQELDRANENRDRQIYPVISPGPEPGTTALTLKVKDTFPMHGKFEVNNQSTPGTPNLRMNTALQYNNLWDLEHQIGLQYTFTPESMKASDKDFWRLVEQPTVANYSGFYRLPLIFGSAESRRREVTVSDFGYDQVTKRFRPPPMSGQAEAIFYASHSDSDPGVRMSPPQQVAQTALVNIQSQATGQDITTSDNLGGRFIFPLFDRPAGRVSLSAGLDYKGTLLASFNTNSFFSTTSITNNVNNMQVVSNITTATAFAQPSAFHRTEYLPLAFGLDIAVPDKWGSSSLSANLSVNLPVFSKDAAFAGAAYSPNAKADFHTLNLSFTREQRLIGEWMLLVRANGQWTDQPLINNEQFGIGGTAGPRGYREGEEYGDTGFRVLSDVRTPLVDIGMVDGTMPMRIRGTVFTDFGRRYLVNNSPGRESNLSMWGAGLGVSATIGQTFDMRLTLAWPLLETPLSGAYQGRVYFGVGAQF